MLALNAGEPFRLSTYASSISSYETVKLHYRLDCITIPRVNMDVFQRILTVTPTSTLFSIVE
jgi:hypothetical protein